MSIELLPVGNKCSLSCTYCYEEGMRNKGNFSPKEYSVDKMLAAVKKQNAEFILFGGEPLLTPIQDLETFWAYGLERFGRNGIQTSLSYVKDRHFELFKKYNVHVGVSLDGPAELNSPRCGVLQTAEIHKHFTRLLKEGFQTSLIATLHRDNASRGRLPRLIQWFNMLGSIGLSHARLHLLETDNNTESLALTEDEAFDALITLHNIKRVKFDLFSEIRELLTDVNPSVSCIWNGCDPYTTPAVQGILSDGTLSNCGRVNKDGVNWQKAPKRGNERLIALYNTPEEYNGCKGCRFFFACKGECPGQSSDWREKTVHCGLLKRIFGHIENQLLAEGKQPISARKDIEDFNLQAIDSDHHGDHYDFTTIQVPVI